MSGTGPGPGSTSGGAKRMCLKRPGPRCSQHAAQRLARARAAHAAARRTLADLQAGGSADAAALQTAERRVFDTGMTVHEANRDFDATRGGIEALRQRVDAGEEALRPRLDAAVQRYTDQMDAWKQSQRPAVQAPRAHPQTSPQPVRGAAVSPPACSSATSRAVADLRRDLADHRSDAAARHYLAAARRYADGLKSGMPASQQWSGDARLMLAAQERIRGERHDGWYATAEQWHDAGRQVAPDVEPLTVWVPVRRDHPRTGRPSAAIRPVHVFDRTHTRPAGATPTSVVPRVDAADATVDHPTLPDALAHHGLGGDPSRALPAAHEILHAGPRGRGARETWAKVSGRGEAALAAAAAAIDQALRAAAA